MEKEAAPWFGRETPHERIFTQTHDQLNEELWDGDRLKKSVRRPILDRLNKAMKRFDANWHQWTKVYFAGSMASLWWGNNDIDILIGVDYDKARENVESFGGLTDDEISQELNSAYRKDFNDEDWKAPWNDEIYHLTAYNNLNSWDVTRIRPYAAYEVLEGRWYVRPPHLPHWAPDQFPQGAGLWEYINGMVNAVHGVLAMPEPYRTREGAALWEFLHSHRSSAFNDEGYGWYDVPNVTEKYLDQLGLWGKLLELKKAYDRGEYPRDFEWSNTPVSKTSAKPSKEADAMVAIKPPAGALDHLIPKRGGEKPEDIHLTLACLEPGHDPGHLQELPDVVSEWAEALSPVILTVQGIGTFVPPQSGGEHVLWASVGNPDLHRMHESLALHLTEYGYKVKDDHGYTPHITLGYTGHHVRFIPKVHEHIEFVADAVDVHVGPKSSGQSVYEIPFGVEESTERK